jgi:WD40 repeat protein
MGEYQTPISLSALHVYHSGIVSMPDCVLQKQAGTYSTAILVSQRDNAWHADNMKLEGHTGSVEFVAFSPNGLRIVSGSGDHTVRVWDAVSGAMLHTLEGHTDWVRSVHFSPNGLRIVSGSHDHTVRVWDAVSGAILHTLEGHTGSVRSVTFSPNGLRIVSGSHDHTVRVWDAVSHQEKSRILQSATPLYIAV